MKSILVILLLLAGTVYSQTEKFENKSIIYLNYVDPQKCDYPHNIPYFYSHKDYLKLEYTGTVSKDSLVAERYWYELDYDEDSVRRYEKIVVHFGESKEDFRHIKYASYIRLALEGFNEESDEYDFQWEIYKIDIDYQTQVLNYSGKRHASGTTMYLEIKDPAVELISFLESLCFFYRNGNEAGTTFRIEEE